ncbi:hypothetical protein BX661DRAFT_181950 [Kickxella alabastrina]|uniref:uncharacterized protein n=1 Tax=Kickxella alabastrina TaxID=61397 RepID=UPI00221FE13F|nr:uncharacterized protein BX661DRAFT_181950 [Kickxella alabastrina]KAI7828361.1 hypothetical protein BX661DRAFT_181950 [Kickxella alabastrina]
MLFEISRKKKGLDLKRKDIIMCLRYSVGLDEWNEACGRCLFYTRNREVVCWL